MKFNKIYFLKNFETDKTLTFPEWNITEDDLKIYNEKGWNIYESVNTFIWNDRKSENIAEIKSCFIDIDYSEIKSLSEKERAWFLKEKFTNKIIPSLKNINHLYTIKPSQINVTYKWFHILFDYEEDCYFIDTDIHFKINQLLNDILGWDENARDIARVYKSVGFIDNKNWPKWKITSLKKTMDLTSNSNKINKIIIEKLFSFDFKVRDIEKIENKVATKQKQFEKKLQNIEKINSIDSLIFIENLKSLLETNKSLFLDCEKISNKLKLKNIDDSLFKFYEEDWKNLTSGLVLEKNKDGLFEINDYSKKTRRWNYNFLKNWIFENTEIDYKLFSFILNHSTWITLNSNIEENSKFDSKLLWDKHYNRMDFWEKKDQIQSFVQHSILDREDIEEEYKIIFAESIKLKTSINGFWKMFRWFFTYIAENVDKLELTDNGKYKINFDEFITNIFWIDNKKAIKNQKSYIKFLLTILWELRVPSTEKDTLNWKTIELVTMVPILKIYFQQNLWWRWNNDCFFVEPLQSKKFIFNWNSAYINKKILTYQSWFKNSKITDLFIDIDDVIRNTNHHYSKKLIDIFSFLQYTNSFKENKRQLINHLEKWKNLKYFWDYEIKNDTLYVYKKTKS